METSKPREFAIDKIQCDSIDPSLPSFYCAYAAWTQDDEKNGRLRVIEYRAYEEAMKRAEELEAENKKMIEALEFYAQGAGVECIDEGRNYMASYVAYENDFSENGKMDVKIGTRARAVPIVTGKQIGRAHV